MADMSWAGKNCVCKANGQDYHEGQVTCILGHLARCEMFLNNTTWKQIGNDCPEAALQPKLPLVERLRKIHGSPAVNAC